MTDAFVRRSDHAIDLEKRESLWRQAEITKLFGVFYWINGFVLGFLALVWGTEVLYPPAPHILSEKSLLALIAGSTTQLGALAYFVGRALIPRPMSPTTHPDGSG